MRKVAIITAASQGMGEACARELAERDYSVVLLARSESIIDLAGSLGGVGIQGSVTEPEDLKKLVDTAMAKYGRIDAVVNNTGHSAKGELLELSDQDWHAALDLLILNVTRMAQLVVPIMQAQSGGALVNISTFGAVEPSLSFPISSALRAALGAYIKLFSERYAAKKIRMNNVLPGFIDSYPVAEEMKAKIPAARAGTVQEIAKTVAFLVSEDAAYISGENLRVDGGLTRSV